MAKELNQQEITERVNVLIDDYPSARAFALKVDLDPGNLNKKRAGSQPWTFKDVRKICEATHLSETWLIDGVGEKYKPTTNVLQNISDVLPNIPIEGNKESYLDVVMSLFKRYMDNEQRYQEIIKENQKIMQQITFIYNKIKEG